MDCVPYLFCDSVATLLRDRSDKVARKLGSDLWTAAAKKNAAKRQNFKVCFDYSEFDGWCYKIESGRRLFTFEEFKGINKRHVRVRKIRIGVLEAVTRSSEHEIREIAAFTAQFVNSASFHFSNENSSNPFAAHPLHTVLRFYRDCAFPQIVFINYAPTTHEDFLLPQLESNLLKELEIRDVGLNRPGELLSALTEFAQKKMPLNRCAVFFNGMNFQRWWST